MYESLKKHTSDFRLFIFAFDDLTYTILAKLKLESVTIITLSEFETSELLKAKEGRTKAEYCWTCTSSVIAYVLDKYNVPSCTYVDADLFFYSSPEILLNELKDEKTVLITEHRFSRFARIFEQKRAGRFCVQFITFTNSKDSRIILDKWIGQCIDWCYARFEDGKFGDQKYLDKWPEEYYNVHILEHQGGGIAPWNAGQYKFIKEKGKIRGKGSEKDNDFEVVFFHFHFVKILPDGYTDLGWNRLPENVINLFYKPYIQEIIVREKFLEKRYPEYKMTLLSGKPHGTKEFLKYYYKRTTKFNFIKLYPY